MSEFTRRLFYRKKLSILLLIVLAFVIFRAFLPYIILHEINKKLAVMKGDYSGHVDKVGMSIWRGAYQVFGMKIEKRTKTVPVPFFSAKAMDLSIEWRTLLHGHLTAFVTMYDPTVNFVQGPTKETSETKIPPDLPEKLNRLAPAVINSFKVKNGSIHFRQIGKQPAFDIYLQHIEAVALDFSTRRGLAKKPAEVKAYNVPGPGDPKFTLDMTFDPFTRLPTFNMKSDMVGMSAVRLKDFFRAYAKLDAESGTISVYMDVRSQNGVYAGNVKPILTDLKVVKWKNITKNPLKFFWEAIAGTAVKILERHPSKRLATIVPIKGTITSKPGVDYWTTILNVFQNAFIHAILPGFTGLKPTIKLKKSGK